MAEVAAEAFVDNDLCGRYMHPRRYEFPDDYINFFRQEFRSSFFEPGVWFLVTTAVVGKEEEGVKGLKGEETGEVGGRKEEEGEKEEERDREGKEEKDRERVIVVGAAKWKRQGAGRRRYSSWINGMHLISLRY